MRRFLVLRVISGLILLSGLVAALVLCRRVILREREELRATTEAHARRIASQIQTGIVGAVEPLKRLGQWWLTQGKPAEQEDWATDGQLFLTHSPGLLQALWIDPRGRQRWSAAPGAVPDLTNRRPETAVAREIATARQSGQMAVSEVFPSAAGEPLLYICLPLEHGARIQGYVVGLYDAGVLASAITKGSILPEQRITILANGRQVYLSARESQGMGGAAAPIQIANRTWVLNLAVPLHYFREFRGLILSVTVLIFALIYTFVLLLAVSQRWSSSLERLNSALTSEVQMRTRAEEEVRGLNAELTRRVEDFETLLAVLPVGIAVADAPDLGSLKVNPALARMLGIPDKAEFAEDSRRTAHDLLASELPVATSFRIGSTFDGKESQIARSDGTVLDVLSFAAPLFDQNHVVRRVLYACVDISERKRLEQQMQKVDRARRLGSMAAGIAHDFNNLLTGILGHASLAAECVPQTGEAFRYISASVDAAQQASSLIRKVLAYTGKSPHNLSRVNPGAAIKESAPWLNALLPAGASLHFDIASSLPDVMMDVDEIRQVLKNLVTNAVEAGGSTANRIDLCVFACEISAEAQPLTIAEEDLRPGAYVRVEVRDNGAGMSPEVAERAFDPFYSTKFLGRGLGLSAALGVVRAHGGVVRLASAPGIGTSVQMFFPACPKDPISQADGNTSAHLKKP